MTDAREPTRLMLVVETGDGAIERLAAGLAATDIASVVIRSGTGRPLDAASAGLLVRAAQAKGVAALIEADARLARTIKADGVHVPVSDAGAAAYAEAREIVGGSAIAGLDAGRSRHDAMTAGEGGADFVEFGIPGFVKDREKAAERRLELVAWWCEIFEVPGVAFDVTTANEVRALAEVQADFVALTLGNGLSPADAADLVRNAAAAIAAPASAT